MKARLLKPWAGNYAGQILSNVAAGSIPADVAEYFDDDDPAINVVREPGTSNQHNVTKDDGSVEPLKGSAFAKLQQAKVDAVQKEHDDTQDAQKKATEKKAAEDEASAQKGSKA